MTSYIFNNKQVSIPGAYSTIKSGIKNPALALAYGNTLLIDTGSGKFFGGGAGIGGTLKNGKAALDTFDNVGDFQKFIGGGVHWKLAEPLFVPGGNSPGGISSLTYIKAATTVPAEITYTLTNGSIITQVRNEGYAGNGSEGDEVRATAVVTVTNAGATASSISILIGTEVVATYTNLASDNVAAMVAGLVASAKALGLVDVISSNGTSLTITPLRGAGASANTTSATVQVTGTAAGNAAAFAGGVNGTLLTRGYASRLVAGTDDSAKFVIEYYRGSFTGLDSAISDGSPYDGVAELSTKPTLLCKSIEFGTIAEYAAWAASDFTFNQFFKHKAHTITTSGNVVAGDIAANPGNKLAKSGTETYNTAQLDAVLDAIADLNYDFILADNWGDNARSANNLRILAFIAGEAQVKPDFYVGGGRDISKWNSGSTSSLSVAKAYNSQYTTVVHGGIGLTDSRTSTGFKDYDSIYKAANILGREAGQAPQIPLTFKSIGIQKELHPLKNKEVELGLKAGVLMTRQDGSTFDIIKGVNTLQANLNLVNTDGTSHSKQIVRIARQLNKEIVFNAKEQLLKKADGTNRNTLSADDVKQFVIGFLEKKIAKQNADNLITYFEQVTVTVQGDAYNISYRFEPNFEVSFLFFTGFMIDRNA